MLPHRARHTLRPPIWLLLWAVLAPAVALAQPGFSGARYFDQSTPGIPNIPELGDVFGTAVAHGDFDCDGYQDEVAGRDPDAPH
ncbi:MAG: hypothetical protein MI919_07835 [Holophagales bacterium]|nr:hypothetical protein [Holophagales bacterium]